MAAALIYFGCAVLWFMTFERLAVKLANGPEQRILFKGLVGLLFVVASAIAMAWIVARELRKQHRIQEQLRQSNATLEQRIAERTAELQTANHELESFCYSVAHDLRAPLRSILGFSQVLAEEANGSLNQSASGYLTRIELAASRMGNLIDAWLQLARVTRGEVRAEIVDLSALADAIVQDLKQIGPERSVSFTCAPGVTVRGDPSLLRILLENLLGNAWKFTQHVREARLEFGVQPGQAEPPTCFVRDNGAGFEMKQASNLFQPFQRLHSTAAFEGTGIGLATCHRIVQRHGGCIWAEGRVNQGATVLFTLPNSPAPVDKAGPASAGLRPGL